MDDLDFLYGADHYDNDNETFQEDLTKGAVATDATVKGIISDMYTSKALYITDLDWWTSDLDLLNISKEIKMESAVKSLEFLTSKLNGRSLGVAYVEFENPEQAKLYMEQLRKTPQVGARAKVHHVHPDQVGIPFQSIPKDPKGVVVVNEKIEKMFQSNK